MAQHDYVIANGTGAAVRSDLNNGLAAIVSQNSGTTEPTTTYAYMRWADTTAGVMKMRNGANNAWITLYQLDGEWSTIAFENGSASAPSIYFKDSGTDTGIYSPGTDQVAISTSGAGRVFVDSSGRVGVGTSSPGDKLEVNGNGLFYGNTGSQNGIFVGSNSSFNWSIQRENVSTGRLDFAVTAGGSPSTKMTLDTSGRLGIGTTSPATALQVVGTGRYTSGTESTQIYHNGTVGYIETVGNSTTAIGFANGGSERARIDSSGRLLVGTSSTSQTLTTLLQGNSSSSSGDAIFKLAIGTATPANGDTLGRIAFTDSGHSDAAQIIAFRDGGTWSGTSKPSRLTFSTTADGASSPTERMRIPNGGGLSIGSSQNPNALTQASGLRLGNATLASYDFVNVTTSPVTIANGVGIGGLAFVQAYNTSTGAQYTGIIMWRSGVVAVVSESNSLGFALTYSVSGSTLRLQTASGTVTGNVFSISSN